MKKLICLFATLASIVICPAQNLVPNPSFETYSACPNDQCQIEYATGWLRSGYSPDYFHVCCLSPHWEVPGNINGMQIPAHGEAYAGILVFGTNFPNEREILSIALTDSLLIGTNYHIQIPISLADNSKFGVNKIGALLSTNSYELTPGCGSEPFPMNNFAHIRCDSAVLNKEGWSILTGIILADSAYTYLNIGVFFEDDSLMKTNVGGIQDVSYYYIDNVYLGTEDISSTSRLTKGNNDFVSISRHPNEMLRVESDITSGDVTVYDLFGRILIEQEIYGPIADINVSALQTGLYIIKVTGPNSMHSIKFIIHSNSYQ